MAFSYDPSDLSTPLNRLRFLVQDTAEAGRFFEDDEITFAASKDTNIYRAAAGLCRAIAAKLSKTPSLDHGESKLKFDADKRAANYLKLAETYDEKADAEDASFDNETGGALNLPKFSDRDPAFTRGLHFT